MNQLKHSTYFCCHVDVFRNIFFFLLYGQVSSRVFRICHQATPSLWKCVKRLSVFYHSFLHFCLGSIDSVWPKPFAPLPSARLNAQHSLTFALVLRRVFRFLIPNRWGKIWRTLGIVYGWVYAEATPVRNEKTRRIFMQQLFSLAASDTSRAIKLVTGRYDQPPFFVCDE